MAKRTGPLSLHTDPRRLAQCVAELGAAIASGEVTPEWMELQALALICDENKLPIEAARVRRWMEGRA